jgi:hypothetical protein
MNEKTQRDILLLLTKRGNKLFIAEGKIINLYFHFSSNPSKDNRKKFGNPK